jgi:hypothetical protein
MQVAWYVATWRGNRDRRATRFWPAVEAVTSQPDLLSAASTLLP